MKFLIPFLSLLIMSAAKAESVSLTPENTVVYREVVDGRSMTTNQLKLVDLVLKRAGADYPIYLVMDCPGGDIYAGEQFIQFAKTLPNVKTVTIFAASMCAGIVEAIPGERLVTENGILMFHRAKGSFEGQFEDGEIESQLALWKGIVRSMEQRNADRLSMSLSAYKTAVKDEMWIYGKQNLEKKSADKVVDILCSNELIAQKETVEKESLFGSVHLVYSGCPLFRAPIGIDEPKE
jgi:ATP-dependent protease ClpP protease subunit